MGEKNRFGWFAVIVMALFVSSQWIYAGNPASQANGKEKVCAVCNKPIQTGAVAHSIEYKGETYYFDSDTCRAEFEKNPGKYAFVKEVFYACPMHPEERSSKQGACSKCGMALKKHEHRSYYVCPMSQCQVRTDEPGNCPKCGMELKKVTEVGACCVTGKK